MYCCIRRDAPLFFFFNDTAPSEFYTLSLHDALPICIPDRRSRRPGGPAASTWRRSSTGRRRPADLDRKSTRLNSSHTVISYAVFCLKKKKRPSTYRYKALQANKEQKPDNQKQVKAID